MTAGVYVYAFLLLAVLYAAACVLYINVTTQTSQLARDRAVEGPPPVLGPEQAESTQAAIRAVLGIDSAAFACMVLPLAYVAVSGLFANLASANAASAAVLNPLWLLMTAALVVGHMLFLVRIISLNTSLRNASPAVLSRSFVSRHASLLTYYRVVVLLITLFNVANIIYLVVKLKSVIALPYIGM